MTQIAPDTVAKRIEEEDDDLLLLDIRPPDGYEEWHVPGSKNINVYEDLKSDLDSARTKLQDLPQNKEIVTVCAVGKMSATATDLLQEMGYEAKTMTDGMQGWGRVHNYAEIPTESGYLIQVARPGTGCLSYIVISRGEAMVIDPSQYIGKYQTILEYFNATLTAVTETHAHADHISGARKLANVYDVPYYLHHADIGTLDKPTLIGDGTELTLGDLTIEVIHTPGHTEGSVTFDIGEEALLTGDTLFLDSVGRPDLESAGQNEITDRAKTLYESLQELLAKQDDRWVLPAHDSDAPFPPKAMLLKEVRERNDLLTYNKDRFVQRITEDIPETPPNHTQIKQANVGQTELDNMDVQQIELGPNQCAAE